MFHYCSICPGISHFIWFALSMHSVEVTEQCIVMLLTLFTFEIQKHQQNSLLTTELDVENLLNNICAVSRMFVWR